MRIPAREIISGDVILFDDGTEAEVTAAGLGDEKQHGLVTLNGKLAMPWMVSVRSVDKPVLMHPAQVYRVRRKELA